MLKDIEQYKERHLEFWSLQNVKSPLIGFTLGAGLDSWSYWHYNKAALSLLTGGEIVPDDIHPIDFVEDQLRYLELSEQIDDDVCRSAMPLASIPWMEAILGCPIFSTQASIKSREVFDDIDSIELIPFNDNNPWLKKYFEFFNIYEQALAGKYPVAQSILRGPSDLACAIIGVENSATALLEKPEEINRLLNHVAIQLEKFLKKQINLLPKFLDGYVIGQYEIWAPEPAIRIQEDFSNLYSPDLYEKFLKPLDERLSGISQYTLIHLHSSSLHLIEQFLEVSKIKAFQITKDPGITTLEKILPALHKIQEVHKPLILKGQFDKDDYANIKKELSTKGFCLQPVVNSLDEAKELFFNLRNW